MLILEPVIEFEPYDWGGQDLRDKIGTDHWDEIWRLHLSKLDVVPAYPGSWHIPINELSERGLLKRIMLLALNESGVMGYPDSDGEECSDDGDRLAPLSGGYILRSENGILFTPQCCTDLGDIEFWLEIVNIESTDWNNIGMGHALMEVRKNGSRIEIRENGEYENKEPVIELIEASDLDSAIKIAGKNVFVFEQKIVSILQQLVGNKQRAIGLSKLLCGSIRSSSESKLGRDTTQVGI